MEWLALKRVAGLAANEDRGSCKSLYFVKMTW